MTKTIVGAALLLAAAMPAHSNELFSDMLCGKLYSDCEDGLCRDMIVRTRCLSGSECVTANAVAVVVDDALAGDQLNALLRHGEGTRVCSEGSKDQSGVFHIVSIYSVFGYEGAPF